MKWITVHIDVLPNILVIVARVPVGVVRPFRYRSATIKQFRRPPKCLRLLRSSSLRSGYLTYTYRSWEFPTDLELIVTAQ